MTVHINFGIPDGTYRRLATRAEVAGVQVKEVLRRELTHAAGELSDFEVWAATLDAKKVRRERLQLPMRELEARLYDAKTRELRAVLGQLVKESPNRCLDFRADRADGKELR